MNFIFKDGNKSAALTLVNPATQSNMMGGFLNQWACDSKETISYVDGKPTIVLSDDEYLLWQQILKQEADNLGRVSEYERETRKAMPSKILTELDNAIADAVSQSDTLTKGLQTGVAAKAKILDRLFCGEVIVKNPVNKKFWPLVNTSHTFQITHFEEVQQESGLPAYKIEAECDFTILMPLAKDNIDFHGSAKLLMAMNHKNLVVIKEDYQWPINFLCDDEMQMLEIIHDGIHHDFAKRGAFIEESVHPLLTSSPT